MKQPPNRIYLQWSGDDYEPLIEHDEFFEITWAKDKINQGDVEYIRTSWVNRLEKIEAAALNLVKVKGRHHTEQAMKALIDAVNSPTF